MDALQAIHAEGQVQDRPSLAYPTMEESTRSLINEMKTPANDVEAEERAFWSRVNSKPVDPRIELIKLNEMSMAENERRKWEPIKKKTERKKSNQRSLLTHMIPKKGTTKRFRNFQGCGHTNCQFVAKAGKACHVPKVHCKDAHDFDPNELGGPEFCCKCYLEPCLVIEKNTEIESICISSTNDALMKCPEFSVSEQQNRAFELALLGIHRLVAQIFSPSCATKFSPPLCVKSHLKEQFGCDYHLLLCSSRQGLEVCDSSDD